LRHASSKKESKVGHLCSVVSSVVASSWAFTSTKRSVNCSRKNTSKRLGQDRPCLHDDDLDEEEDLCSLLLFLEYKAGAGMKMVVVPAIILELLGLLADVLVIHVEEELVGLDRFFPHGGE